MLYLDILAFYALISCLTLHLFLICHCFILLLRLVTRASLYRGLHILYIFSDFCSFSYSPYPHTTACRSLIPSCCSGTDAPRSAIEARILNTLDTRENNRQETYIAWVKGHKDIKGNEKADKLSKETSILGHDSEGVVTPASLKAWARRETVKARGGSGQGILGWHRKAISAHTWCVMEKGPQNTWLHKIKKSETPVCRCQQQEEQSGQHLAARCSLLTKARNQVERQELLEWKTCHTRRQRIIFKNFGY